MNPDACLGGCRHLVDVDLAHGCHTLRCVLCGDLVRDMKRCPLLPPPVGELDLTYVILGDRING